MAAPDPRPIHLLRLPGGEQVTTRRYCLQDAPRLQAYVRALAPEARYSRFLGAVNELSDAELTRLAADPDQGIFLAETGRHGARAIVGEVRYAFSAREQTFEFAVSVAEAWRGKGLGKLLVADLECRARELAARRLTGDVLRTNAAMQGLARKAGFSLGAPREPRLVRIVKDLSRDEAVPPCRDFAAPRLALAA